jgi:hypothetical protein
MTVGPGTSAVRAELIFDAARADERWRPVVWVMLAETDANDSVRVDLWEPKGWDDLAVTARRIEAGAFAWRGELEHGVGLGEARRVTLDWSQPDRVEVRVGDAEPVLVPIDFRVKLVVAGCSGVKGRVRRIDAP